MLARLADLVATRPRLILGLFAILIVGGAVYGHDVAQRLSPAGYEVGGSESTLAGSALADEFDTGPANLLVLATVDRDASALAAGPAVDSDSGVDAGPGVDTDSGVDAGPGADSDPGVDAGLGVDTDQAVEAGLRLTAAVADLDAVDDVVSYWATGAPQLRSIDGEQALIAARIVASEAEIYQRAEAIVEQLDSDYGPLTIQLGGTAIANLELVDESENDLLRAELIAIPLTTIIMLLVFRSVVAALLPLVVSAVAVVGTAVALKSLTEVTLVSIFALNLTTALGLGMGIDFSLFTISRWREERAAGADPDTALRTTVQRAGRSVLFSGLTTAATLAALLLFNYPLLRSLAYAGFAVVVLATLAALLALPATMALLGDRIDRFQIRGGKPVADSDLEQGRWYRIAKAVMRRPVTTSVVVCGVLLLLGSPFLRAEFAIPDDRALPVTAPARQVADDLRANFDASQFGALAMVSTELPESDGRSEALDDYAARLSVVEGVGEVETATGRYQAGVMISPSPSPDRFLSSRGAWLSIVPAVEPISLEAEAMAKSLRVVDAPARFMLGGESARMVDNKAEIRSKVVPVAVWVVAVVGVLLFAAFRSVLLPIKAVVLNLLSLTAAFGAIVWIFQDGRLSGLLGFTPTGLTDAQTPVLVFCIAFGLSMDYEVFLLSRIKEEYDRTGDTSQAVAFGLQRTGGIITAAAVLMSVVFFSFATGRVSFIQLVGIGLALSILADAFLVRTFLVPAFMSLAGRWNWWAPSLLSRPSRRSLPGDRTGGGPGDGEPQPLEDRVTPV